MTIPNGADFDDVVGLERHPSERFRITHTGSFFGRRDPRPFLQALHDSGLDVVARFLGDFRESDREWAAGLGLGDRLELLPYAPRAESLALQRDSEALLLLIPEADGRGKGVLSGKVFEYIAVGRPILAVVPPDGAAAELIRETGAGVVAPPDDRPRSARRSRSSTARWRDGGLPDVELSQEWRDRLSRRTRVEEMAGRPPRYARVTDDVARTAVRRAGAGSAGWSSSSGVGVVARRARLALPGGVRATPISRPARTRRSTTSIASSAAGNSVLPDQGIAIEARGRIPPDETFTVAVGEPQEGWSELTATPTRSTRTCATSSSRGRARTRRGSSASPATAAPSRARRSRGRTRTASRS